MNETPEQRAARLAGVHRMHRNLIQVHDAPPPAGITALIGLLCLGMVTLGLAVSGLIAMLIL